MSNEHPTNWTPAHVAKALRDYNAWRRGSDVIEQPRPADIGLVIDAAIAMLDGIDAAAIIAGKEAEIVRLNDLVGEQKG